MKYFYIYIDSTAAYEFLEKSLQPYQEQGIHLRRVNRQDIAEGNILQQNKDDILALFMPGARSSQIYYDDLGGDGFAAIQDYVMDGGSYVGICAGAYLACHHLDYRSSDIRKNGKYYDLNLFDGRAVGELSSLYASDYYNGNSWHSVVPTPIEIVGNDDPVAIAYWRGPYYQPHPEEEIEVLAYYHNMVLPEGDKAVAMAVKTYGKGKALFCGVHPELSGELLEHSPTAKFVDYDDGSIRKILADTLKQNDVRRQEMFRMMIDTVLDTERGKGMGRPYDIPQNDLKSAPKSRMGMRLIQS